MNNPLHDIALARLAEALQATTSEPVDQAMDAMHSAGFHPDFLPHLIPLLTLHHHHCHEDLVRIFQDLREPRATQALYEAAHFTPLYLEFDYKDGCGFARKIMWALADIGTEEACRHLVYFSHCASPEIAGYAVRRLENWERELPRKGPHPDGQDG